MAVEFKKDDLVRLKGDKFGLLDGSNATVKRDYPTDFRVLVDQLELVISDPHQDLEFITFGSSEVREHLVALRDLLGEAEVTITPEAIEITIKERQLLAAFGEDHGYQPSRYSYGDPFHMVTCGPVTFLASANHPYRTKGKEWLAAQQAAQEATTSEEPAEVPVPAE